MNSKTVPLNIDKEFLQVRSAVMKNSFYDLRLWELFIIHIRPVIIIGLGVFLYFQPGSLFSILSLVVTTLGLVDLFWLLHDIGHRAVFKNNKHSKNWIDFLSILFFGFPFSTLLWGTHHVHHANPNIVFKDSALDTAPVYWTLEQIVNPKKQSVLKFQNFLWFFVALPIATIYVGFTSVQVSSKVKKLCFLVLIFLRWFLLLGFFPQILVLLFVPQILMGVWTSLVSSLSHFALDQLTEQDSRGYVAHTFETTQNIPYYSDFSTWITGGLNFHIEHHLFPNISSRRLKHLSEHTSNFAKRFHLPYKEEEPNVIIGQTWNKLRELQG